MTVTDGAWALVDHDPATGRTVWRCTDGKLVHYRTDYPVDGVIAANAARLNDTDGQRFGDGRRVASIPLNTFFDRLAAAQAQGDDRYLARWLNDGDNRAWRTFPGWL